MTSTDNIDVTKEFQSHVSNVRTQCSLIKQDICTASNIDNIDDVTPTDIKTCKLTKIVVADYLLSLINLSDTLCKCDYICKHVNQPNVSLNNYQLCNNVDANHKELVSLINTNFSDSDSKIKNNEVNIEFIKKSLETLTSSITNFKAGFVSHEINITHDHEIKSDDNLSESFENPTGHIQSCDEDFIDKTYAAELTDFLNNQQFEQLNGRSVLSFGEVYKYTGSPKTDKFVTIPEVIKTVITKIESKYPGVNLNSCLINKYNGKGSFLPPHSDDETSLNPMCPIFTVSLGCTRMVTFRDKSSGQEITLDTNDRSLYIMSGESQSLWSHRIDRCSSDSDPESDSDECRYSITLRDVNNRYKNTTVILGDSNTKHIKFGSEKGTFGRKLPGKREEVFRISSIDVNNCIGYRNVVLHVGTNDLRDDSPHRPKNDPPPSDVQGHFNNLVTKIKQIQQINPKCCIMVSSILPTKVYDVNARATEFNRLLTNYSLHINPKIRIIYHDKLVLNNSLNPYFACYKDIHDKYHLGKKGIRALASAFMGNIINREKDGRLYSSVLSGEGVHDGSLLQT